VIAASFSQTYKRNAFNNGFLVLDSPDLYDAMHARLADPDGATIPGPTLTLDFTTSQVVLDGEAFAFSPLSTVAQELIAAGGAEALVRGRLS
jgi:homoaconitate hydratase